MSSKIKEKLNNDEIVTVFGIGQIPSHKIVEMVALAGGIDAFWIDQEHGALTQQQIEIATLACRAHGLDSFVRMAPTDYAAVMTPLEAGAGGVMAAQVRTVQEAEQIVQWAKFYPTGLRGINGGGVDGGYSSTPLPDYAAQANRDTFLSIQIETREAIENVEGLAAIEQVDLLFVGPSDLAQSLGVIGQFDHPKCIETIERIAEACQAARMPWGIIARNAEYSAYWVERGCRLLVLSNDVRTFYAGFSTIKKEFADFIRSS